MNLAKSILPATFVVVALVLAAGCGKDDPATPESATGIVMIDCPQEPVPLIWTCRTPAGGTMSGDADTTMTDMALGEYGVSWYARGLEVATETRFLQADSTIHFRPVLFPEEPEPSRNRWFFDVVGTSDSDIVAVGAAGTMVRFDGGGWTRIDLGVSTAVTQLTADPDGTMWACGHFGWIWRRTGSVWNAHDSGTVEHLFALGAYRGELHAGGMNGCLRRFDGVSWVEVGDGVVMRDVGTGAPTDTLALTEDVVALTTINAFCFGGAFRVPGYVGDPIGMTGTQGMILADDVDFAWELTMLDGSDLWTPEWVLCSTSDPEDASRNYLGTSRGGLLELESIAGGPVWVRTPTPITSEPDYGVRDLWLDAGGNLYLATDEGEIVYRPTAGPTEVLHHGPAPLVGIWGTGPDNLYVVGFMDETILHCSHDPAAGTMAVDALDMSALWPDD